MKMRLKKKPRQRPPRRRPRDQYDEEMRRLLAAIRLHLTRQR